jgi:hypothetical protein
MRRGKQKRSHSLFIESCGHVKFYGKFFSFYKIGEPSKKLVQVAFVVFRSLLEHWIEGKFPRWFNLHAGSYLKKF